MSDDRQQLLLEELQLILLWDRWWGDLGDYDGQRARQMRVEEIVVELCRIILPIRPYFCKAHPPPLHPPFLFYFRKKSEGFGQGGFNIAGVPRSKTV